jgi:phage replication O-like protein O
MALSNPDPFVRLSNRLLEALLACHLTGIQLRIVLWVLRNTDGWNRRLTPFRWSQIARKLDNPRTVVWRAGQRLLQANVLLLEEGQLRIQKDAQWRIPRRAGAAEEARRCLEATPALPRDNASVTYKQRISVELKTLLKTY